MVREAKAKGVKIEDTMNPYDGKPVRSLQEDLYKTVILALNAMERNDDKEAYYLIRCGFDIVAILRPGYYD